MWLLTLGVMLAAGPVERPAAPQELSEVARGFLKKRMAHHRDDAMALLSAVVTLQRAEVRRFAQRLATEPSLARALPGDDELTVNSQLPEQFFRFQDELKARARVLADTAEGANEAGLGRAFSDLTQTCMACHAAYLKPVAPPSPQRPRGSKLKQLDAAPAPAAR